MNLIKKHKFLVLFVIFFIISIYSFNSYKKKFIVKKYNILIICANCLNKNRLGIYGNRPSPTPNIDNFSKGSFVFDNLISPRTYTNPCIYELLNSKKSKKNNYFFYFILKDMFIKNLKSYNLYFPKTLFEKIYNTKVIYNEPFFIFDHNDKLHSPYDINFNRIKIYKRISSYICSYYTKKILAKKEAFSHLFYRIIFGNNTKIYEKDILNWNKVINIIKNKKSIQYKILKDNMEPKLLAKINNLDIIDKKSKNIILKVLNKCISVNSNLFDYIKFNNNIIKIGKYRINILDTKNKLEEKIAIRFNEIIDMQRPYIVEFKNGKIVLNTSNMTNFNIFSFKMFCFSVLAKLFPQIEKIMNNKIFLVNNNKQEFNEFIKKNFSKDLKYIKKFNDKKILENFYDENLIEFDERFGNILKNLKKRKILDKTIIVLMGDHGEALLEHNDIISHGTDEMYNEIISPPLIIKFPDINKGKRIKNIIRMMDIIPTILDYLGYNKYLKNIDGMSFLSLINKKTSNYKVDAYSKGINNGYSIVSNDKWKLIYNTKTEQKELYNLNNDPKEAEDLSLKEAEKSTILYEKLLNFISK